MPQHCPGCVGTYYYDSARGIIDACPGVTCPDCEAKDRQELSGFGVTVAECFSQATQDAINLHEKSNVQQAFMRLGELIDAKDTALAVADEMATIVEGSYSGTFIREACRRYRTAREGTR